MIRLLRRLWRITTVVCFYPFGVFFCFMFGLLEFNNQMRELHQMLWEELTKPTEEAP